MGQSSGLDDVGQGLTDSIVTVRPDEDQGYFRPVLSTSGSSMNIVLTIYSSQDAQDAIESLASGEDSSHTSYDQIFRDSVLDSGELMALSLPSEGSHDFMGIGHELNQAQPIPETMEDLPIGDVPSAGPSSQFPPANSTTTARPMMGLPSVETRPESQWDLDEVCNTIRLIQAGRPCEQEQLFRTRQYLLSLTELVSAQIVLPPPAPPIPPSSKASSSQYRARCLLCSENPETVSTPYAFRRHVNRHIPQFLYHCPAQACQHKFYTRRDKMRNHVLCRHRLNPDIINQYRVEVPPPGFCPLCSETVQGWDNLYKCLEVHCRIAAPPSVDGDMLNQGPGPGPGGNGGGHASGNGAFLPGSGAGGMSSNYTHAGYGHGQGTTYGSAYNGYNQGMPRNYARPGAMPHTRMNTLPTNVPLPGIAVISTTIHTKMVLETPPQPDVLSQKRKRPSQPKKPQPKPEPDVETKCTQCGHPFKSCHLCHQQKQSSHGCHECWGQSALPVKDNILPNMAASAPQDSSYSQPLVNPYNLHNLGVLLPELGNGQSIRMPLSPAYGSHGAMQMQGGSFNNMPTSRNQQNQNPPGGSPFIGLAVATDPIASISETLSPKYQTLDSDTDLLHDLGLGTLIKPNGVKVQSTGTLPKLLRDATSVSKTGPGTTAMNKPPPSAPEAKPSPPGECQCPYRTVPRVHYSAQTRAELSPGKHIEMSFKMAPADREAAHPLRTRVRVVVKLLKLRSSVAGTKQKGEKESHSTGTCVPESSPPESCKEEWSSACEQIALSNFSNSFEEIESTFSFSFDLRWAIRQLSRWSWELDCDTCLKFNDPGYVLDLVAFYVLQVFLLVSRIGGDGVGLLMSS
ncbi:hypothetical protein NUU61_000525 [Penicillium alfredii]|uniref:C2H2-type domain-containing protein n=1 Tax=Penicillium alfredii TaxID=1506179 RepID=A0A9W9KR36_9EURO|nr:uncharacterized protein NUU61_000525 [Penicillium alfredii]KAJ5114766.1 hypothetical protein NUU61_000525 [Penicillium alfredii]